MDTLTHYRTIIVQLLQEYSQYRPAYGDIRREVVIDSIHDHYQLLSIGWQKHQRIHGTILHLDICDGKIWVQYDGTEEGIANRLLASGIPASEIVLAFHPPYKRSLGGFAVR